MLFHELHACGYGKFFIGSKHIPWKDSGLEGVICFCSDGNIHSFLIVEHATNHVLLDVPVPDCEKYCTMGELFHKFKIDKIYYGFLFQSSEASAQVHDEYLKAHKTEKKRSKIPKEKVEQMKSMLKMHTKDLAAREKSFAKTLKKTNKELKHDSQKIDWTDVIPTWDHLLKEEGVDLNNLDDPEAAKMLIESAKKGPRPASETKHIYERPSSTPAIHKFGSEGLVKKQSGDRSSFRSAQMLVITDDDVKPSDTISAPQLANFTNQRPPNNTGLLKPKMQIVPVSNPGTAVNPEGSALGRSGLTKSYLSEDEAMSPYKVFFLKNAISLEEYQKENYGEFNHSNYYPPGVTIATYLNSNQGYYGSHDFAGYNNNTFNSNSNFQSYDPQQGYNPDYPEEAKLQEQNQINQMFQNIRLSGKLSLRNNNN